MTEKSRDQVVSYILNEVWGPTIPAQPNAYTLPQPDAKGLYLIPEEHKYSKIVDPATGDLIVQGSTPANTYGTGVLHAPEKWEDADKERHSSSDQVINDVLDDDENKDTPPDVEVDTVGGKSYDDDDTSFSLDQSQKVRPNAMGLTVEPTFFAGDKVSITFSGAIYEEIKLMFADRGPIPAWKRVPLEATTVINWNEKTYAIDQLHDLPVDGDLANYISLKARFRKSTHKSSTGTALTATFVAKNKARSSSDPDVFQARLTLAIAGEGYFRDATKRASSNFEQQELDHLYRHTKNFGTGHGTAVEWDEPEAGPLREIATVAIPHFYQEVLDFDALPAISMNELATATREQVKATLGEFLIGYADWIESESQKALHDSRADEVVVARLKAKALHIHSRIRNGFNLVCESGDASIFKAFQLANKAMFEQQKNGKRKTRKWSREKNAPFAIPRGEEPTGHFGNWRPFQIAFLLSVIPGLVDGQDPSRDEIDLIFFPTGGGKTEAYLGASAFAILHRRLTNSSSEELGVDVLMRYTLRLLTIQQFERSAGLITVLELMRAQNPAELGTKPISIGVWLGRDTTPNTRKDGYGLLGDIKDRKEDDPNPFILSRCPVCAAEFGWEQREQKGVWRGYSKLPATGASATIRFICSDRECKFGHSGNPLPIWLTDEDVYKERPSFILGTVDKFAQMAWRAEAKSLFNINSSGERQGPPPSLIIQDELHLISGPLGSMVGLYEPVIEALCTDNRGASPIKPKIVASTATTRNYESQMRGLYGRESVMLFPQAIDRVNETYFSQIMIDADTGAKARGSLYLGINPATYGSAQTSAARLAAILKQAPNMESDKSHKGMDHYRTSVWFFNSLKELGMTLTLMQSVTRDMIGGMKKARRLPDAAEQSSYPYKILELTSRIDSNKVSSALTRLGLPSWDPGSYDTCLASSIMEVGVDVPRLGLLTIMSQPKTTASYIQVSGRVGRNRKEGPGLVVMLYNSKRSRDRSVYERFQSYHETVYAQVEPISVTPFAIEAMQHGLKGALIAMYRMTMPDSASPNEVDWENFDRAADILRSRILSVDVSEQSRVDFERQVAKLRRYWGTYHPTEWGYTYREQYIAHDPAAVPALMRGRREDLRGQIPNDKSMLVMTSMRSVDGQTRLDIAAPYAFSEEDH